MPEALGTLVAALLDLVGFGLLALTQERHYETVFGPSHTMRPDRVARLRDLGFALVACSLPICIAASGSGFGSLLWVVLMAACAGAVALALTWQPRVLALLFASLRPSHG